MPRNMRIQLVQLLNHFVCLNQLVDGFFAVLDCSDPASQGPDADPKALQKHCGDACFNSVNAGIKDRSGVCLIAFVDTQSQWNLSTFFSDQFHWVNLGWLYSLVQPNLCYICG